MRMKSKRKVMKGRRKAENKKKIGENDEKQELRCVGMQKKKGKSSGKNRKGDLENKRADLQSLPRSR